MKRIVELDGLRGLAALFVVFAHYFGEAASGPDIFKIGWIGVNIFFVLSGFLIGSIILNQSDGPNFFKSFYFRRAARILPVYFLVFMATIFAAFLTRGHTWSDHPFPMAVYATFTTNFAMTLNGYGSVWLRPVWTLAVEEQFYLLLPLLIVFTPRRYLVPALLGLWAVALACRIAFLDINVIGSWTLLPCRMDLLLSGLLLALVYRKFDLTRHLTLLRIVPLVCMVSLALISNVISNRLLLIATGSISSIGIACFLLAIFYGAPEGIRYRGAVLCYFGQISYMLYLVHQPISGLLHGLILNAAPSVGSPVAIAVSGLAVAVSVAVAAASWQWLEKPIMRWASIKNIAILNLGALIAPVAEAA